jgi:uncharacterized protein (DUF302 family)
MPMVSLGFRKTLNTTFDEALIRVPDALKSEGFGVLTEIDVQGTLKQKLGVEFRRYKILGACNPPFAYEALQSDLEIGILLPCNVVVYENDDGHAAVLAMDPTKTMAVTGHPKLTELAAVVAAKLNRAIERLE